MPGIWIVGMADKAVQEARERVKSALKAAGFSMPQSKIVVNLAPGDLKKGGSGFDLPIALGVLAATRQIDPTILERRLFVGELSLEGSVREVAGFLAYAICAAKTGDGIVGATKIAVPIAGLSQESISHLGMLHCEEPLETVAGSRELGAPDLHDIPDFKDVAGHEVAKRALQIAAAGRHGLLMVGPPGSGKTMLASRLPSILPQLNEEERMEAALVHSVAGEDIRPILAGMPPFRHPHHSSTLPGLIGGGSPIRPGEISLAHRGVLFLDELAEFKGSVLQGLRQPLESGEVTITRASGNSRMPASFMLVAATNPCPCGYYGDDSRDCTCTSGQIRNYQSRVGGPLVDRFHIQLDIRRMPSSKILQAGSGTSSEKLREGVLKAREFSDWRRQREVQPDDIDKAVSKVAGEQSAHSIIGECNLCKEAADYAAMMADSTELSARSLVNSLRVSRTIADMDESLDVGVKHIAEAFGFRLGDCFGT